MSFRNQRLIRTNLTTNSSNGVGGYAPYCYIPYYGIGFQYCNSYTYPNGWTYYGTVIYSITSELYVPSANYLAPSNVGYDMNTDGGVLKSNNLYILVTIDIQNINTIIQEVRNSGLVGFYTRLHVPQIQWTLYRV